MKNQFLLLGLVVLLSLPCYSQEIPTPQNIRSAVSASNIIRASYPDTAIVNLYQGNGKFGCSYGPLGLHINPSETARLCKYGKTQYVYMGHRIRAKFGADYLIPLSRLYWEKDPSEVKNYRQCQSFYDGTLSTHFEDGLNKITVTTWFDPVMKDLSGINIDLQGKASDVLFEPFEKMGIQYGQDIIQSSKVDDASGLWKIALTCHGVCTVVYIKTNMEVYAEGKGLRFKLHPGKNEILLSVNHPVGVSSCSLSYKQTIGWWHAKWNSSGMLILPDSNAQKMWVRSMAMFLFTYGNDQLGLAPPMGFTGNGWPFGFPQDVSYVHPVLLATGNLNIAKSWVEYWSDRLSGMKEYTRRLLKVDGVLCPWVFPYNAFEGFHDPTPPNVCYYEIHNSGYLARMAYETAVLVNNEEWTHRYAMPLVKEAALFYKNICIKRADGLWHLSIRPSMGQDEMGGINQDDYLCALFSAKYCFQKAIEYHLDIDGTYRKILHEGLAFPVLKSKKGCYFSCQGRGEADFGNQKHPVQLNELAYLPVEKQVTEPTSVAYNIRYEITQKANVPFFNGWTLGEFLLAGSRMGNVDGWRKDWDNLRKSDNVDPDWIQVYETSQAHASPYYTITNGLIVQSLINNLVSDWYGKLEIGKCNPWEGKVYVKDIYSLLGVKVSGKIEADSAALCLKAWKDCQFELYGEKITLKKNQQKRVLLNLKTKQVVNIKK